ncbi:hypothetical protein AB833_23585 [Chromatiales bacterium (ex Bugula neritina AB1)]|nr:hypothetical protein AB833_23585 [Chromatiales bacterium (ex Bugula neritina AB1)]
MKIEILCTGDEILTGKTVNTNHSYIARRFTDNALQITRGTTVGDDRESLLAAFQQASVRADAVIVNGGLGPTVDDLSQEVAAHAAGVELELYQPWLEKLKKYYESRGRQMPENNTKQAMLPVGCEFIDNPVGTACGFAVTINNARFFFTPGVPHEMRRMINEEILPRILKLSGLTVVTRLKRFHSFGIGESRADQLLRGIEDLAPDNSVKLGFQSHFPQLETKLAAIGKDEETLNATLAPLEARIRQSMGNFILCEDNQTLESEILKALGEVSGTLATIEMTTGGLISQRLNTDQSGSVVCSIVSQNIQQLAQASGLERATLDISSAAEIAIALRRQSASSHSLVSLMVPDEADDSRDFGADVYIALSSPESTVTRKSRLTGGRKWITLGATEMSLDCLRRYLLDLPVDEKIDFEQH